MGKLRYSYPSTVNVVIDGLINIYSEPSLCIEIIFLKVQCQSWPNPYMLTYNLKTILDPVPSKLFVMQIKTFFEIDSYESFIHSP